MKQWSTERFFLYRENPFRILYMGGLGFQEPPSKLQLSSMQKRTRDNYHIWLFMDKKLAASLARGMSKDSRVAVAEQTELRKLSKGAAHLAPPSPYAHPPKAGAKTRSHRAPKPLRNKLEYLA